MEKRNSKPIVLMVICTLLLAVTQYFWKLGSTAFEPTIVGLIYNWPIWIGFIAAGSASILMTFALKNADLSHVYPIISLSFVWTTLIATLIFDEILTLPILLGILIIIVGVGILAYSGGATV